MKGIWSNYHLLQALKSSSPRLRIATIKNSERDLGLGIAELALSILNGNCNISKSGVDRLHNNKAFLNV
jgi:hypothetical protein